MDMQEAEMKRAELAARLRQGQLSADAYAAAISELRVTDAGGQVWQPDPGGSGWLVWNGSAWQPGTPPAKGAGESRSSLMTVDEFRKVSKEVPLAQRPQRWWDLLTILGGVVAAVVWFLYGGLREGFDWLSALLMIAIPVALVLLRPDIDILLQPLQPARRKISRIILIGLGLAAPFLTAWILYNLLHISQYPLMQANLIVGTLVAYAITRDPVPVPGKPGPGGAVTGAMMIVCIVLMCSLVMAPVLADDCTRDPLNAQDCLRTDGYAEVLAGIIATILSGLVNGPIIIQSILTGSGGTIVTATAAGTTGVAGGSPEPGATGAVPGVPPGTVGSGGPGDNPFTQYTGGNGPGGCG